MDYTYRERHGEAIYRFKGLPSRRRGTACSRTTSSAQHDVGSDYPHSESTFPQSRKIPAGVPDDKQAKIADGNTAGVCNFDVARLTVP
jgi:hypothetical protein